MKSRRSMILACICAGVFVLAGCGSDDGGGNGNGGGNNGGQDTMTGDEDTMNGGEEEEDTMNGGGGEDTTNGGNGDDTTDNGNGGGECQPLDPPPVQGASCSVLCQDCSGDQACVIGRNPQSGETVQRCQRAGSGTQGDTCGQNSGCQPGYGCIAISQGGETQCRKYCRANSDASPQCGEDAQCQSRQGERYGICIVSQSECSLYPDTSNSCGDGETCSYSAAGKRCVTYNENASAGDSCQAGSDCGQYQICVASQGGGGNTCVQLCNPEDPQNCSDGQSCTTARLGQTEVNLCR